MEYISNEAQLFCFCKMNFFDLQKVGNFFIYLKHFGIRNWLIIKLATKVLTNEINTGRFSTDNIYHSNKFQEHMYDIIRWPQNVANTISRLMSY